MPITEYGAPLDGIAGLPGGFRSMDKPSGWEARKIRYMQESKVPIIGGVALSCRVDGKWGVIIRAARCLRKCGEVNSIWGR